MSVSCHHRHCSHVPHQLELLMARIQLRKFTSQCQVHRMISSPPVHNLYSNCTPTSWHQCHTVFLHKLTKHALNTLLHAFARQVSSHMDFLDKPSCAYNKVVAILHDLLTDPQLQILTDSPFLLHLQNTPMNQLLVLIFNEVPAVNRAFLCPKLGQQCPTEASWRVSW